MFKNKNVESSNLEKEIEVQKILKEVIGSNDFMKSQLMSEPFLGIYPNVFILTKLLAYNTSNSDEIKNQLSRLNNNIETLILSLNK